MKKLSNDLIERTSRPIKVLQFGEGNFLRAFVDWFISELNKKSDFNGGVCVVQPIENGRIEALKEQDGLYTLILEGIEAGKLIREKNIIDVIEQTINPYEAFDTYMEMAKCETLEFVISNTTEAGIVYEDVILSEGVCPKNFPAKLLLLLKKRYDYFEGATDKGLNILPCELIDYNGKKLQEVMNRIALDWNMAQDFIEWLNKANTFCSTLVDRIVPGYPVDSIKEIQADSGYEDSNIVKGEVFHLWVIEDKGTVRHRLPLDKLGFNVKFVEDLTPFKQQKVRILNGAHTSMVPVSFLFGIDTVGESINDALVGKFVEQVIFNEIIPASTHILDEETLKSFANSVLERFANPTIRHELISISLNSTTKFKTRILPSLVDYVEKFESYPKGLSLSLAATLVFFRGQRGNEVYKTVDNQEFLDLYDALWSKYDGTKESCREIVDAYLGMTDHWEVDFEVIDGFNAYLADMVYTIVESSMEEAIKKVL